MKKKSSEPSNSTDKTKKKEEETPSTIQTAAPANKLAEQRELLRGILDDNELLELAVDGILIGSHDGIIIDANSYMQQLTGRTLDKLIGAHISTLFSAEELNKNPLRFDLLHKGEVVLSERNIVRPDGKIVPIEMHTKMMPNGTYQSIYRDITERKTAEKALKESEEKYRKTFYISPDAVNIIRLEDGMRVSINSHFTKVMGYTESDIIGKTTRELDILVNPEDRKRLVEGLKKDGIVENLEAQFRKKNGEIVLGSLSASVLELDGVPHIISVTRDITERKQTEEALRKSESKLRAIFAAMTDVIMVVDAEGRYLEIAPSNPSLLYKPSNELLGKTMHEVFPKEQADFFLAHVTKSLDTQHPIGLEYILEIENKKIWFSALVSPLTSDSVLLVARDVTEQKKAEEKLKESDQTYRGIINCIDEAIYVQDKDGTFLDVNEGAVKMYGYTREELIGKNPLFVSAEGKNDFDSIREKLNLAIQGYPQEFEFWGKRKNGQIFPKQVRVYKGIYFEKEVVIAVAQDISEKKQVVQTLKASEELFRNLVENISDVFYISDANGRIKYCSPNFFTTTGFSYEEIINNHFVRVCAPIDRRRVVDHYAKEIQKGVLDTNLEFRIRKKDGTIVWIEQNTRIVRDEKENIVEHRNIAHDIDDRKRAEASIRKSEEWFRNLFEKASDGIFHSSLSGKFVTVNESFAKMHGYTVEEMQKINIQNLDTPEGSQLYPERIRRILAGENLTFEVEHYHKNGHTFPLEVTASMITVGNEKFIIAFHRDITARKKAEEKIKKLNRLYTVLSNVNQAIVRIKDREQLFNETCRVAVDDGKFVMVWIGVVNPSTNKVDVISSFGVIKDYLDKINIDLNDKDRSGGIVGQAIKQQTHIIVNDIKNDNSISQWKEDIIKNGYNSAAAFPLTINGKVIGSFALYASEVNFFDEDEIKLLDELTTDISFALEVAQHEVERKQAEEELRKKEDQMRLLVEGTPYLFFYTQNINAEITYISPSVEKITGHPVEQWYNQTHWFVTDNKINETAKEKTHAHLLGEFTNSSILLEVKHADNHPILLEIFENPVILNGKIVGLQGVAHNITEQKRMEKTLKESEERFRLISNLTSDYIFSTKITDDGNIEPDWVMGAFKKITGYTIEEYKSIGGWQAVLHPDDSEKDFLDFQKLLNNEKVISEVRTYHKNGNIVWSRTYASPIWDDKAKKLIGIYGAVQDITEKKYAEELINESEKKFRKIAEGTKAILFNTSVRGKFIYANQAASEVLGFENKDLVGKFYLSFVHPNDRAKVHSYFLNQLKKNERDRSMDFRYLNASGKIGWLSFLVNLLYIDGKVAGFTGVAQEITERKHTEEALRKSELHFRSVWENAASGMRLTDERGIIIAVNNAFCQMVGKTKDELEGFHISAIYSVKDSVDIQQKYKKRFKTRTVSQLVEKEFILWNDKKVWFRVVNSFIESEYEKPLLLGVFTDITEQKLAEGEIKKLSQAVEQSAGAIVITDLDGNIEYVNKKFEETTGYTFEEVKGRNPRLLKSGETPIEEYKKMWECVLAGSEWRGTFHNKRKDGSLYWEATTISPIKNNEGKITNFLAIKDDITQDKLKEEMLKQSELHFRTVWESSLDGIRLTDEHGMIVSVNNAFAKLFEKDKNEIIGKSFADVYGLDSGFNDAASFVNHFKARTIQPFMERDITLWNGKPMSIELTNSFVEIEGEPPLLLSIFNNVTERVKNERLLKESNEFNTSLLKNVPFGMDIVDDEGIILFQSDNLKKIIDSDVVGKKCWEIYSDNKTQCLNCPLKSGITVGKTTVLEISNIINGRTFEVFHTGIILTGKKALLETFVDISERKQAEREITFAKEKAEEANKVKTNFLENMSHELRTPMIPILGFTELMIGMDLPDEVKNMAVMMNKGGNRLMETLNIILDLAQIEKERVIIKPTKFNLLQIIDEVCGMFQPIAKGRNLYLKKELQTETLTIASDERMLRHAINNLINNGLKFTNKGGVTVKASLEKTENRNFAVIQICDTGIGVPKDQQDIIWEEFRQASEGIGRSFEGNGLGLTITKNFIEKLNGKVSVESEVGKGSTFTIKLPMDNNSDIKEILVKKENGISEQSAQHPLDIGEIQKAKEEPVKTNQLRKVLYVEDEEISFSVVNHFLKNVVSLDWAKNGQEGIVMARGNKYEAILMDINLAKGIDGMQTTKLIREMMQYQQTPIIAITAYAMRGAKEEFLGAGCSHYISKPFTKTALLQLMGEVLEKKVE